MMLLCLFIGSVVHAQKTVEDYLHDADMECLSGHFDAALASYTYVVNNHSGNLMCPYAFFRIGLIYTEQGRQKEAIRALRTSLTVAHDKGTARRISVYTFDPHSAAFTLCNLYEQAGNYDSAMVFLGLSDTVYRGGSGCGNSMPYEKSETVVHYARLWQEAGNHREAERALLQWLPYGTYGFKDSVIVKLAGLFRQYEQPGELRRTINSAINYFFDTVYYSQRPPYDTSVLLCVNFMDVKIKYYYDGPDKNFHGMLFGPGINFKDEAGISGKPDRDKIIASLKRSDLYRIINQL